MMKLFYTKDSEAQFKGQEEPSRFDEPTVYRRVLGFVHAKRELFDRIRVAPHRRARCEAQQDEYPLCLG